MANRITARTRRPIANVLGLVFEDTLPLRVEADAARRLITSCIYDTGMANTQRVTIDASVWRLSYYSSHACTPQSLYKVGVRLGDQA